MMSSHFWRESQEEWRNMVHVQKGMCGEGGSSKNENPLISGVYTTYTAAKDWESTYEKELHHIREKL